MVRLMYGLLAVLSMSVMPHQGTVLHAAAVSPANSQILRGAKPDNSGAGGYYPWEDADAIRGLRFDAHKPFVLRSVRLYNEKGNSGYRRFSLLDSDGKVIASKKVFVHDGEQRVTLNLHIPKGKGWRLVADIHRGLYRNTNVDGYPYRIGDIVTIVSSDRGSKRYYYFFYDWEVVSDNASVTQPPVKKPSKVTKAYIPQTDFQKEDIYGNGQVVYVDSTEQLRNAIENLRSFTTVVLKDGRYPNVHTVFPKGVHHVTIKAAHKGAAVIEPAGKNDDSAFVLLSGDTPDEVNHHINFIGFTVKGADAQGQFLRNPSSRRYGPSFIYMKDLSLEGLWMGIFSGLHAHDWTVDRCLFSNSQMSHMWYMCGWHLSVINSEFRDGSHDYLAIRGYYPEGEVYDYYDDGDENCRTNIFVEKRKNRKGFLPRSEWTHLILNNRFLSWHMQNPQRSDYNTHVAIAYGLYEGDSVCNAERVYLPPQNIEISDNLFDNSDEAFRAHINAIKIDAREGINNDNPAAVNGIVIHNNRFNAQKEDEKFIETEDDYDLTTIDLIGNKLLLREHAEVQKLSSSGDVTHFGVNQDI